MSNHIICCVMCGSTLLFEYPKMIQCIDCYDFDKRHLGKTTAYTSKYPKEYYENLSLEKYNTKDKWKEVFVEIELSKQPEFSYERYKHSVENQIQRDNRKAEIEKNPIPVYNPNQNKPKCPTCGSTNIRKISTGSKVFGAAMFGLFSKTARSQFECKHCGYKW